MKSDVFNKPARLKNPPNLGDYDEVCRSFDWRSVRKELDWFDGTKINAAYNAIDRHTQTWRKNKVALYWEDEAGSTRQYTFEQLSLLSNKMGNILKDFGVSRGERVFIFLPRVPELYISFLGALKIGAIAGTLFSAFQEQALADRLGNSDAEVVITNKELKERIDKVRKKLPALKHIITVDSEDFIKSFEHVSDELHIAHMDPDEYAFMLYTSGTTGKPKGVVHVHRAILQEHMTAKWVLDLRDDDTYWCTADPGWVTGIAYEILGSWSCGVAAVVYAGRFDPKRWYEILAKYKVSVWYTAPTAIRMLMAAGSNLVHEYDLSSLRHMCSVGEPLNPEAITWAIKTFDKPFHDTWWQTETGAICIANYPAMDIKIGSMGKPVPGITAAIVDDQGHKVPDGNEGNIALKPKWPSMMHTIWRRPHKYESYFTGGWYISGDRGMRDKDGYFWFIGRADDVIKTAGERVGPFEVESALVSHPAVVEAGVIGKPDAMRGEIIKAFVVLDKKYLRKRFRESVGFPESDKKALREELSQYVKKHLAGHAYPREVEFIDKLPKTRSGKIMRRILKAKEMGLPIGDTSTLEEY
ncbi:acetate--CoA ligase [Candidatus Gottesmanbacteria bacterium RIFCSPLOWO2_01_FULL_49_10]|uniref:acetate--CoA ligase n=1 Tax=Candidatus Gottesmanbacteria bacterium RIFCSPLOWO2_01_FULL_49_10 TaxID=1798396 RepID=A0A1F6B168_9BACT|nr:MAG: Acetyl-CoA synthetase [Microgenomates group bacterium GW2011_GWA2_47_8]OGG30307.1 MAG: acetate--CoA ligase [Candidatus Gottesmanbacteria bacterium RIFCSPLOWO2_01_FULL_49_10]HLD24344.1 acetate--CoA ligase [Patescibacteria group bacterium]